jgi:hypothetical protein
MVNDWLAALRSRSGATMVTRPTALKAEAKA